MFALYSFQNDNLNVELDRRQIVVLEIPPRHNYSSVE